MTIEISSLTRREQLWVLACLLVILRVSYLFALDDETGRWQSLLTIPWFLGLFIGPVILVIVRQVRWPTLLVLELLAVLSFWLARGVEPVMRPVARRIDHRDAAHEHARHDDLVAQHEAELRTTFASPQTVQVVDNAHVILNGGYALSAPQIRVPPSPEREQYYAALAAALTGQTVTVTLDSSFARRYAPTMRSGTTDRYRFGRGAGYGEIPATIHWHGQELVGWKGGALVWAER